VLFACQSSRRVIVSVAHRVLKQRQASGGISAANLAGTRLDRLTLVQTNKNDDWYHMLSTILLIILIIILIGALPTWPYSGGWGYYPSGGIGLLLLIVIILLLVGYV
jgi:hypothetical protein